MEYNLYDELVKALGTNFKESTKDFSVLKQYLSYRLGNLIYRNGSVQHFGTSHSIFYLNDLEDSQIYQGFWDLEHEFLTIGPVNSFNSGADGKIMKVSSELNHVSFVQRKDGKIITAQLQEKNGVLINTRFYTNDLWNSTCLEYIGFIISSCNVLPDYEFQLKKDETAFVLDTFTNVGEVLRDWHTCYSNESNSESVSIYFDKIDKIFEKSQSEIKEKKKTI